MDKNKKDKIFFCGIPGGTRIFEKSCYYKNVKDIGYSSTTVIDRYFKKFFLLQHFVQEPKFLVDYVKQFLTENC
jgi:hypothetical protein